MIGAQAAQAIGFTDKELEAGHAPLNEIAKGIQAYFMGDERGADYKPHEVAGRYFSGDENKATEARLRAFEICCGVEPGSLAAVRRHGRATDWNVAAHPERGIIDNPIGGHYLAFAGVLQVNGDYLQGTKPVVMVQTEKKVVAGTGKALKAVNAAGGVKTLVYSDHMTRDVAVVFDTPEEAQSFHDWVNGKIVSYRDHIAGVYEGTMPLPEGTKVPEYRGPGHGKFVKLMPFKTERGVHLKWFGTCGAAMGMNDVTTRGRQATGALLAVYKHETGGEYGRVIASGNACTDKKAALMNKEHGRGVSVKTEFTLPEVVLRDRWKTTPQAVAEVYEEKCWKGSDLAGALGHNANVSNTGAGLFLAFGQDIAQITEFSLADGWARVLPDGSLEIKYDFPAVEVGTIGGATGQDIPFELLGALGFHRKDDTDGVTRKAFAELCAAAATVNDANLIFCMAADTHGSTRNDKVLKTGRQG